MKLNKINSLLADKNIIENKKNVNILEVSVFLYFLKTITPLSFPKYIIIV